MNIVYTCDDYYADIAGVSIVSLFENNKEADVISLNYSRDGGGCARATRAQ